jgi:hypothetical protein
MDYAATAPTQGADYWEFISQDGQIRKRLTLPTLSSLFLLPNATD